MQLTPQHYDWTQAIERKHDGRLSPPVEQRSFSMQFLGINIWSVSRPYKRPCIGIVPLLNVYWPCRFDFLPPAIRMNATLIWDIS